MGNISYLSDVECSALRRSLRELSKNCVRYAADLHKSCDFTLKNFDVRQEAMSQEIEALNQAKAVLSGADFS